MAVKNLDEKTKGFTFYWKINHFSLCSKGSIISPGFRVEEMDNTEWNLSLDPGVGSESNVVLNIYRQGKDEGPDEVPVDVKLFLLKTNGEKVIEEFENAAFRLTYCLIKPLRQKRSEIFENETLFLPDDTLVVGCFIKKHSKNMNTSIECTAYSEISTENILFEIPFIACQQQQITTISRASVTKKYPDFEIILESSHSIINSEFMTAKIVMANSNSDVFCKCELSVEDTKKKTVFLFVGRHKYLANTDDQSWSLTNSVTSGEIDRDFSTDYNFILRCVLTVSDGNCTSYIKNLVYSDSASETKQLDSPENVKKRSHMEKIKCLFEENRLCDFTLQVDDVVFRIHKTVLGAVSPVFCAMFEVEMKEKENSLSVVKDIDANTMRKIINFAYTESVENLEWEDAIKLYVAADRYQILDLKQCCANWIINNVTIENVTEVLVISDMYQDNNLELAAKDFVFSNAKEVFRSENWNTFIKSKVTVAIKIMQEICIKLTANHI